MEDEGSTKTSIKILLDNRMPRDQVHPLWRTRDQPKLLSKSSSTIASTVSLTNCCRKMSYSERVAQLRLVSCKSDLLASLVYERLGGYPSSAGPGGASTRYSHTTRTGGSSQPRTGSPLRRARTAHDHLFAQGNLS